MSLHPYTVIPDSPWARMAGPTKLNLNKGAAFVHWTLLLMGTQNPIFWDVALVVAVVDTLSILFLVKFRFFSFPGQVRLLYLSMLSVALSIPGLSLLIAPMAAGFASFIVFDICPMARTVGRLPWNQAPSAPVVKSEGA